MDLESQTLPNQNVKRTRVSIAAVFHRPLNNTNNTKDFSTHLANENVERSDDANKFDCIPHDQQSDVPNYHTFQSHWAKRRVIAARFQQIAPKPMTQIASNVKIPSLDNLPNAPTTDGNAKRKLPTLCKKPSQKKTEETETLDNFGLESAMVGS